MHKTSNHVKQMAEDFGPPCTKKHKRSTSVKKVPAEERAKQFKEDLYVDGGILFCKYCQHSVDYVRVDTIKDHIYVQSPLESIPSSVIIPDFWMSMQDQYPLLSAVANQVIWMPVASVDCERSFSQYKH